MNLHRVRPYLVLLLGASLVASSGNVHASGSRVDAEAPKQTDSAASVQPKPTGRELFAQAAEMERLAREIEARMDLYAPHPKRRGITTSTQIPEYREYIKHVADKIELVSREHYPDEASSLSGNAIITISIGRDGTLLGTIVNQSTGHKELDDAAVKFVRLAAPFEPLPNVDGVEILDITRTFQFTATKIPPKRSPTSAADG